MSLLRSTARVIGPVPVRAARRGKQARLVLANSSPGSAPQPAIAPQHPCMVPGSSRGFALRPPKVPRGHLNTPGAPPPDAILYPLHDSELSPEQRNLFREIRPQLLQALYAEELTTAKTCWDIINDNGLIGLFRPYDWKDLSNAIIAYGTDTPQRWDKTAELAALDEMTVQAGARGYDDGLCARMRYYISIREPEPAIRLFTRTCVINKQRDQVYAGHHKAPDVYQQLIQRHGRRSMVQPSTIGHALAAFAQKDDFSLAIRAFLHPTVMAQTIFDHGALCRVLPTTAEDPFLVEKATAYSYRVHLAILLQVDSESFSRFIERLTLDHNTTQLMRLLYRILDELNHPEPFIVYRAEDVTETKPVLLDGESNIWGMLLYAAMIRQHPQLVKRLQESIRKAGIKIPGNVLASMLRALAELGKFDDAHRLWDELTTNPDVDVDIEACTSYVSVTFDARGERAAFRFLDEVEDAVAREVIPTGAQPVYNAVLERLARNNRLEQAHALFDRMRGAGIPPDVESYNILLRHYVRTSKPDAVQKTFADLKAAGIIGNIESYCLLLAALDSSAKKGSEPVLPVIVDMMKEQGYGGMDDGPRQYVQMARYLTVDPNIPVAPEHAVALAWDLLKFVDKRGWPLWNFILVLLLAALERRPWPDPALPQTYRAGVRELAARHLPKPIFRSVIACRDIVHACFENPEPAAARRAWDYYREHMKGYAGEYERAPNIAVWMPLLNGLRMRREWALADELVQEIESYGEILTVGLQHIITLVRMRIDAEVDEYDLDIFLKESEEKVRQEEY